MGVYVFIIVLSVSCVYGYSVKKTSCFEPKIIGPCRAQKPRWFFNQTTSTCEKFFYGGCKGNNNNFMSIKECKYTCQPIKEQPAYCKLKPESGECPGYFPRYYYDAEEDKCETFIYSGCNGNDNRFMTEKDCFLTCRK